MLDQTLGAFFGVRRVEGRGNIGITVSGSGGSVYELTKALNGSVTMTSRKGAIAGSMSSNRSSGWSAIRWRSAAATSAAARRPMTSWR